MTELHLPQVENKDSCLLSQLRLTAVISVYLLQDSPHFSQLLFIGRAQGRRELKLGSSVEQGTGHKKALHALCVLTAVKK